MSPIPGSPLQTPRGPPYAFQALESSISGEHSKGVHFSTCQPWHLHLGADSSLEVSIGMGIHQYSLRKANAPAARVGLFQLDEGLESRVQGFLYPKESGSSLYPRHPATTPSRPCLNSYPGGQHQGLATFPGCPYALRIQSFPGPRAKPSIQNKSLSIVQICM